MEKQLEFFPQWKRCDICNKMIGRQPADAVVITKGTHWRCIIRWVWDCLKVRQ